MLVLAFIQFAYNIQENYTLTNLTGSFNFHMVQGYNDPQFIDPFGHLSFLEAGLSCTNV